MKHWNPKVKNAAKSASSKAGSSGLMLFAVRLFQAFADKVQNRKEL